MTPLAAWSRLSLRTKSLLVLSIPIVPLLIATAAIMSTAWQQREAQQRIEHTLAVKAQISMAQQSIFDAEAAIKDLWLSREARASDRFGAAVAAWPQIVGTLVDLVADNPIQHANADKVRALRNDRPLISLRTYLDEHPEASRPPLELLDRSTGVLDAIRVQLDEMQRIEDRLLTERGVALRAAESRLLRTAFWGAVLGLVGGVVCSLSFSREVSRRVREVGDNAYRLVKNEPLHLVRPAQDEIGTLGERLEEIWGLTVDRLNALDRARSELGDFFDVSLDLLCIADVDGRFIRLNPAWRTTLGWELDEILAQPYAALIHPDDIDTTRRDAARQAEQSTVITIENRYRCKDGSYRWLSWKSVSRPEAGLIFAAARDVTEHRRVNAELQARVTELRELNQELEAFSYSVSHDLRAPLRHVTGFNGFIQRSAGERLTEQERRWLSQSIEAAQRMGRLIDDLLAFSKMGRSPLAHERVRLDAVIRDARQEVSGLATDGRHIDWRVEPLPEIRGDSGMLRHAFVNLLDNAVKYTQPCQHATIEVGTLPPRDGQAVIFVRDNGVGFDMQYAHKLFGVFQRLHAQEDFEGTGIGLANVRRIVLRHGGQTWAEGAIGGGATFYVSLPLLQEGVTA